MLNTQFPLWRFFTKCRFVLNVDQRVNFMLLFSSKVVTLVVGFQSLGLIAIAQVKDYRRPLKKNELISMYLNLNISVCVWRLKSFIAHLPRSRWVYHTITVSELCAIGSPQAVFEEISSIEPCFSFIYNCPIISCWFGVLPHISRDFRITISSIMTHIRL